jgi:FdhD protein
MNSSAMPDQPELLDFTICRVRAESNSFDQDPVAIEEPLEIRLGNRSISITMRTPGYDFELAAGFLFNEGIIKSGRDIQEIKYCGPDLNKNPRTNVVRVELHPDVKIDLEKLSRHFYTSSSCGVCGKSSIEALKTQSRYPLSHPVATDMKIDAELFHRLPEILRNSQGVFDATGGIHASALFSTQGNLLILREDIGRHNALDKLIGHALMQNLLPLKDRILMVSGRASFELVQKASMAGVTVFAAVGAPSSLAIELAKECGMTLLGFVRNKGFNIYSHGSRIRLDGRPYENAN